MTKKKHWLQRILDNAARDLKKTPDGLRRAENVLPKKKVADD